MSESFEYAIKKDVRNNPIVREVDEARQRELWKSVGIAGFLVLVLLFSAWQHFELLRHGYQIEEIQRERAAEQETARRLRLEVETLKSPQRIEALATQKLHLVAPGRDEAIVIKRDLFALLARPIDGGRTFRGQPLFGRNKTWRGLAVMSVASVSGDRSAFSTSASVE